MTRAGTERRFSSLVGHEVPSMVVERILQGASGERDVDRSHGCLPLYLDVAAEVVELDLAAGRRLEPDAHGGPLPRVVRRLMSDLRPVERDVIRTAAILRRFSRALLCSAMPHCPRTHIDRFLGRPLLRLEEGWLPWSMHEVLCDSLIESDRDAAADAIDRWTADEWVQAAQRALDELGKTLPEGTHRLRAIDRDQLAVVFVEGLSIAGRWHLQTPWIAPVAQALEQFGRLDLLAAAGRADAPEAPQRALVDAFVAVGRRRQETRTRTVERLRRAIGRAGSLPPDQRDWIELWLAKSLMHVEDVDREAEERFSRVAARGGADAANASKDLARLAWARGDFPAASRWLRMPAPGWRADPGTSYAEVFWAFELLAELELSEGRFADATAHHEETVAAARAAGSPTCEAGGLRHRARALSWAGEPRGERRRDRRGTRCEHGDRRR